ncbi:MAG: SDR family NAD(P)-dependent oxidoreductase [Planctomycetota bacterium]
MSDLEARLAKLTPAQRALFEKRMQGESPGSSADPQAEANGRQPPEPIAIVGMACRLPGAETLDDYWRLIRNGECAITETPADRWDVGALHHPEGGPGKVTTRWGGFLKDIDRFDPRFFGISPREANRMDPQQRLLLEVAWEALEHAGTPADTLAGSRTGVFVGIGGNDYSKVPLHEAPDYFASIDGYMGTGNALSIAANRLSYLFDLKGPSLAIDTACSSSSVAIYLAIEALRRGECDGAVAAGVNAILTPETTIAFSNAQMLSPRGRCRPFDVGADGYARGEGCGVVYLRRLSDARRDGDQVLAVLRAAAINQDGRTSGISAPNGESQKTCICAALRHAGVDATSISYVEAHGTGTPLGDPIEMGALAEVFRRREAEEPPVRVTSVKANIGHTETVSGIAGLIKVALMMRHGVIPPQLGFESLNPHIDLSGSRVELPSSIKEWSGKKLAGVSSFGFGGTNSHLIVESAADESAVESSDDKPIAPPPATTKPRLLKLTGKSVAAVEEQASQLAAWIAAHPETDIDDVCHTANTGRSDLPHRAVIVAEGDAGVEQQLAALADSKPSPANRRGEANGVTRRKAAMLFSGQGSQLPGMGRELYLSQPVYRDAIDRCAQQLSDLIEESLTEVLFGERSAALINETIYTQPALFATEYALGELWRSWGVQPDMVAGHSVGEYVAAVAAGVVSAEDGLRLVTERARLMQQAPPGGKMAAVFADERSVANVVKEFDRVAIAAANSPENTVVSGEPEAVDAVLGRLTEAGFENRSLAVSHAFHSPMMDDVLDDFEAFAGTINYSKPRIPLAANVTGGLMRDAPTARYWRDHLRGAVRFADNLQALSGAGAAAWIEVGPGASLLGMAKRTLDAGQPPTLLLSLRKGLPEMAVLAGSLAEHYATGGRVSWRGWDPAPRKRLLLPTYPFERVRCWLEDAERPTGRSVRTPARGSATWLGDRSPTAWSSKVYESTLSPSRPALLADHRVQGSVVTPAAVYVEQALQAAAAAFGEGQHVVRDLRVSQAMTLAEDDARRVQVVIGPELGGRAEVTISSQPGEMEDAPWTEHASATIVNASSISDDETLPAPPALELLESSGDYATRVDGAEFYERVRGRGFDYGPSFQVVASVAVGANEASGAEAAQAQLQATPATQPGQQAAMLPPVLGDACLQTFAAALSGDADTSYLPVGVREVRLLQPAPADASQLRCVAVVNDRDTPDIVEGDAWLIDAAGAPVAALLGIRVQRVGDGATEASSPKDWLYRIRWRRSELKATPADPIAGGAWLVVADEESFAGAISERLLAAGNACVTVTPGDAFELSPGEEERLTRIACDLRDESQAQRLIDVISANPSQPPTGVIFAAGLDIDGTDDGVRTVLAATRLVQQLARRSVSLASGVSLVTHNAQPVDGVAGELAANGASLVGFGRVARTEHPELTPRLIDLDGQSEPGARADQLLAELAAGDGESEIAYRGGERCVARLERDDSLPEANAAAPPASGAYQLRIPRPGAMQSLRYEPVDRRAPGDGEVEIEVYAAGLNFSDVLKALSLYPGVRDAVVPLGIEASGVVTAVGAGVARLAVGDEVFGVAPYAFGSHATTSEYTLAPKPPGLSHAQATTLPITFLTAHHALVRLADLQPGERVLIHAGAGGVGLAAIQIAQALGAEVFATAGSEEKRDYLRRLGVRRVMNSRTLDFAEEVLAATDRQGVDVVLNSLPGEAIPRSLSLLRAYGRFLEIGKTDIYQDRRLGLLPFQDNLSYFAIDLDRVLRQRPDYVRRLMADVVKRVASGDYRPLAMTQFGADQTVDAFRYMSQRKNIGKVVVTKTTAAAEESEANKPALVRRDGAYLITGGLGALGLQLAERLAREGAGAVALLSRRPPGDAAQAAIDGIQRQGARVVCLQADAADASSLERAVAELRRAGLTRDGQGLTLRGVIHAAGVLDDGLITRLTESQIRRVLQPKVAGAQNLHRATLDADLDFFVLFSSVAAVLGSPGQANYAAANASLDALAHQRRRAGLPALSINWGPWADAGMAAQAGRDEGLEGRGLSPLPAGDAFDLMLELIESDATQVSIADIDWSAMRRALAGRPAPLLGELLPDDASTEDPGADHALRRRLLNASPEQRLAELVALVRDQLARVMSLDAGALETDRPMAEFGIDSLMSLELKNSVERQLGVTVPMAKLLEGPSVDSLAAELAGLLVAGSADSAAASVPADWSPLATLQTGAGAPLFLLPALGGDVACYRELAAALPQDLPVMAFRPRGLDDPSPPHAEMPSLAADYASAIRRHQPAGPYRLAGWSTGGVPALAVAEQLQRDGARVELVALFDTPLPLVYKSVELEDEAGFLRETLEFAGRFGGRQIELDAEQLRQLPPQERFGAAVAEARRAGLAVGGADEAFLRRVVAVGVGLIRASRDYTPPQLAAPVHLFRPMIDGALPQADSRGVPDHGWREAGVAVEVHQVDGDHFTMMQGAGAEQIAEQLANLLAGR